MRKRDLLVGISFIFAFLVISYAITVKNILGLGSSTLRPLAHFYLTHSFSKGILTSHSTEVVTAIVWNYRGFDTLFETFVFFLAIMGTFGILRFTANQKKMVRVAEAKEPHRQMDLIVRSTTKIVIVAIVAVSASIALHGHITPGGGFQSGSAMTVAALLLFAVFSKFTVERKGLDIKHVISAYTLGLSLILLAVLLPLLIYSGKILQINLLPGDMGLLTLDVGEYIAVTSGFFTVFLILGISEHIFKKVLGGEKHD